MYYSLINECIKYQKSEGSLATIDNSAVPIFPDFREVARIPSETFFQDRFLVECENLRSFWDFCIQRLDSVILKADHTFNVIIY